MIRCIHVLETQRLLLKKALKDQLQQTMSSYVVINLLICESRYIYIRLILLQHLVCKLKISNIKQEGPRSLIRVPLTYM